MAQMRLLITDNGTHPPEKWAEVIADDLIEISPNATAESLSAGQALRHSIIAELIPVITEAQEAEKDGRHGKSCHCWPHMDAAKLAIKRATDRSQYREHFKQAKVRDRIHEVCGIHLTTAMKVEADHKEFKAKGQSGNGRNGAEGN